MASFVFMTHLRSLLERSLGCLQLCRVEIEIDRGEKTLFGQATGNREFSCGGL
jgi:hypothetical protein